MAKRDYSLLGPDGARAVETGLAAADWYHSDVPRKDMKALMQRSDAPAIRDTAILFGAMVLLAGAGIGSGRRGGPRLSGSPTASFTARRWIRAGTNAATAPPSRRGG